MYLNDGIPLLSLNRSRVRKINSASKKLGMHMKLNVILLSIAASVSLFSSIAQAAVATTPTTVNGGTVHFTGEFVTAGCVVSTDTANQTVELGQYTTNSITTDAQMTTAVPFNIKLVNCDTTVADEASIAFNGVLDTNDPTLLAVNSGGSNATSATGVGIELLDSKSEVLTPDGTTFSTVQTLINGSNTLPFFARYKSTSATVTAGQADADATFVIKYQ